MPRTSPPEAHVTGREADMSETKPRILCVDDNHDTAELVSLLLRFADADYEVESVEQPEEALRLAAAGEFDLYVLDYMYPRTNGVEVCKRIRLLDPHAPVMFFTAEARERVRQEALAACADAYLVKPDDLPKVAETARRLLTAGRASGARD